MSKKELFCYDIARNEEQKETLLNDLKLVYKRVEARKTTTEANPEEFPYTIYVSEYELI